MYGGGKALRNGHLQTWPGPGYCKGMAEARIDVDKPVVLTGEEDEETLAAIDRGIRDADAGRLTPLEEVEKMLPQWISKFSSPTSVKRSQRDR